MMLSTHIKCRPFLTPYPQVSYGAASGVNSAVSNERARTSDNLTLGSSPPRSLISFSKRDSSLWLSLYRASRGLASTAGAAYTGAACSCAFQ